MGIVFKSKATGDLFMLSAHAEALLAPLGKDARVPGIFTVDQLAEAVRHLKGLSDQAAVPRHPGEEDTVDPDDLPLAEAPVSLHKRAVPLVRLLEQALHAGEPVTWGV